ncbi:MAG TPA: glucose 1-dehydrogenase [Chloroflexota bacterium]|nr:glucose 1-dehydrogenase [Chloroflexota bacterium]
MSKAEALFDLSGKVALITGGNSGIGLGIGRGLAQCGASVAIAARRVDRTAAAAAELAELGVRAIPLALDVADAASVERAFAALEQQLGRLDILVNNSGINIRKPAHDLTLAEWTRIININLTGAFLCSKAAYPLLKRNGAGKIINIGSMMSLFGASYSPAYGASKGGIVQLTKSLAMAWAADNIQVNAILPGWIDTELTQQARIDVPGLNEMVLDRTPAGRWGRPEDMAGVGVFLASAASNFVTGAAIPVDGGYASKG